MIISPALRAALDSLKARIKFSQDLGCEYIPLAAEVLLMRTLADLGEVSCRRIGSLDAWSLVEDDDHE